MYMHTKDFIRKFYVCSCKRLLLKYIQLSCTKFSSLCQHWTLRSFLNVFTCVQWSSLPFTAYVNFSLKLYICLIEQYSIFIKKTNVDEHNFFFISQHKADSYRAFARINRIIFETGSLYRSLWRVWKCDFYDFFPLSLKISTISCIIWTIMKKIKSTFKGFDFYLAGGTLCG